MMRKLNKEVMPYPMYTREKQLQIISLQHWYEKITPLLLNEAMEDSIIQIGSYHDYHCRQCNVGKPTMLWLLKSWVHIEPLDFWYQHDLSISTFKGQFMWSIRSLNFTPLFDILRCIYLPSQVYSITHVTPHVPFLNGEQ
jgi:hypothetical protein